MKLNKERAKFIVIYGPNNIGKTTQIRLLAKKLIDDGVQLLVVKYPLYLLKPTGPQINKILRGPLQKKVSEHNFQKIYAQNRKDFQDDICACLNAGITVLAEDYTGTGIAWGMTRDETLTYLEKINSKLLVPDLAILLDGQRFKEGHEEHHRNESDGDHVWSKNRQIHLQLGKRYKWQKVKANDTRQHVNQQVWKIVSKFLEL